MTAPDPLPLEAQPRPGVSMSLAVRGGAPGEYTLRLACSLEMALAYFSWLRTPEAHHAFGLWLDGGGLARAGRPRAAGEAP